MALVGIYGGYFGAGAGIIMLALLSLETLEPFPVTNAVKNITLAAANLVAAVIFAFASPVDWPAAAAIGIGVLAGSWCGPAVVPRTSRPSAAGGDCAGGLRSGRCTVRGLVGRLTRRTSGVRELRRLLREAGRHCGHLVRCADQLSLKSRLERQRLSD